MLGRSCPAFKASRPAAALFITGATAQATIVRFSADLKAAEVLLAEIMQMQRGESTPKLLSTTTAKSASSASGATPRPSRKTT